MSNLRKWKVCSGWNLNKTSKNCAFLKFSATVGMHDLFLWCCRQTTVPTMQNSVKGWSALFLGSSHLVKKVIAAQLRNKKFHLAQLEKSFTWASWMSPQKLLLGGCAFCVACHQFPFLCSFVSAVSIMKMLSFSEVSWHFSFLCRSMCTCMHATDASNNHTLNNKQNSS